VQHLPRTFKRVDDGSNADVQLWWCWMCGRGMWKKHSTGTCPKRSSRSPSPARGDGDRTSDSTEPSTAATRPGVTFSQAAMNRRAELNTPARRRNDDDDDE
jgi:hypothetical protein